MTDLKTFISKIPLLIRTFWSHYIFGPPQESWNITFHLVFALIKSITHDYFTMTVEDAQQVSGRPSSIASSIVTDSCSIPISYHQKVQPLLEKILKPYKAVIDDEWKHVKKEIDGEWVYEKQTPDIKKIVLFLHGGAYYLFSHRSHRLMTSGLASSAKVKILAINYRLAPQHPFPAALHDALAAYSYLLETYPPEKIVFAGDSAGGGLSIATCLAIRDMGLPMPAGIICFSPWLDLTSSMPSSFAPECIDVVPRSPPIHPPSPAWNKAQTRAKLVSEEIKKTGKLEFKVDESLIKMKKRLRLYAVNEALWVPYVSPLLADDLNGLPPILIQVSNHERLRDESVLFAFRVGEPQKVATNLEQTTTPNGSNINLELYDEMPHVFQSLSFSDQAKRACSRASDFIDCLFSSKYVNTPSFVASRITMNGTVEGLAEAEYATAVNWNQVGKVPTFLSK